MSDLKTRGFVSVDYPKYLRDSVERAVQSWKEFCLLPLEVKKSLPYSNKAAGIGYEFKFGEGPKGDRKENFDASPAGAVWLRQHASAISNPVALRFVEDAAMLARDVQTFGFLFAQDAERELGLKGFHQEVVDSADGFFVRFIHYFGDRAAGDETASAHADQSGFTLHLFESAPGLQCLTLDEKRWVPMPVSEGETVIIPAMQLQLRSKGLLTALAHRVVATEETAAEGRFSAVCFVQLKGTPKYDKDTHGRLQEKEPGFNYGMPINEFGKLFKA